MMEDLTRLQLLELIGQQAPLQAIFACLTTLLEIQFPEFLPAVYYKRASQLTLAHAPSLPPAFAEQLQTLAINEHMTTLGAAASKREAVITTSIRADMRWQHHTTLADEHAIESCWARPITHGPDSFYGVLALFGKVAKKPSSHERRVFAEAAHLMAIAMSQRKLLARLQHQGSYDALTGLANRKLMLERLEQAINVAGTKSESVAVIILDIDNFKMMNQNFGASSGDELLKAIAERLRQCLYARDTVARLGEDEFGLVIATSSPDDNVIVAEKILAAMNAPFQVKEHTLSIGTSLGVGVFPEDGQTCEQLLQAADTALNIAKTEGKHQYRFFRPYMGQQLGEQLELSRALKAALESQGLVLYYQPRVNAKLKQIVSAEALIRWQHPQRGLLMPGSFLKVAEKANLMTELDAWVLREVCQQLKTAHPLFGPSRLSCNISPASFQDKDFANKLIDLIKREKLLPDTLEIEITEDMLLQDPERAATQLTRLKVALPGLRVAIDDFGTGHSSLAYLRYLPVDTLKIDRLFVGDLDKKDEKQRLTALAIIRTVILLGHELHLKVVAEGAETPAKVQALTDLRCDEIQGFIYSKPLPLEALQKLTLPKLASSQLDMKN
jgi:diguanylate cyclase (GGDEF)-like protein